LRLDFNENTVGCSPRVLARLRSLTGEDLARYPEREPVEALAARHLKIQREELLLINGVDEGIHLLCETYLEPGDEALIVVPTFAMYEISAAATGARVLAIPATTNFEFPVGDLLAKLDSRTRLVAIANPNNPTGSVAESNDLLEIARRAPNAAILVDEAYFEFYGRSLAPQWREHPNLFIARTFSKAYGMAGLRVGTLMGTAEQIAMVRRVASPYNVNSVALACLPPAIDDQEYVRDYASQVRLGRGRLARFLTESGVRHWPSQANFVLASFGHRKKVFVSAMRTRGILVRDRSRDPGCEGCVRITLGTLDQTARLLDTLEQVLGEICSFPTAVSE